MLDDAVRAVLGRLEDEDRREREEGIPREARSRAVAPSTGRFLFSLVAPQVDCEGAGARRLARLLDDLAGGGCSILGGHAASPERDTAKCDAWRRNVAEAGLEEWAELREGDAYTTLGSIDDVFDVVFLDAEKEDYEALFHLARRLVEPGGVIVADNVLSHAEHLAAYSRARQADPTLSA